MTQYAKRKIDVIINLGEGVNGDQPGKDVLLSGYRCQLVFEQFSTTVQGMMQILIFGLPLSLINQLTRIGYIHSNVGLNSIRVLAGDEGGPMSKVYEGIIQTATGDFSRMPEVSLSIFSLASLLDAVKPVAPSSFPGATDVGSIMQGLAKTMGLAFVNENVKVMLSNPYFPGTALNQVRSCAMAANINFSIHLGTLRIWTKGTAINKGPVEISPETGLVGYPSFSSKGILVDTLFNPNYELGGNINVTSSLLPACGVWNIFKIFHSLASETPGGPWFSQVAAARVVQPQA